MSGAGAGGDFWVVTTYYNPVGWRSRLANYHLFRSRLDAPLLTVEWDAAGRYELDDADADLLVRIAGGDTMWQKERLLGIALAALPAHVQFVAWLDCDVFFASRDWHERTRALLGHHDIVQPFRRVTYLDAAWTRRYAGAAGMPAAAALAGGLATRPSFLDFHARAGAKTAHADLTHRFAPAPDGRYPIMARPAYGHAWAARREVLERTGWYERCVLGGGDLLHAYGVIGQYEALIANHQSVGWDFYGSAGYRRWAESLGRLQVACGDEELLHLHHGALADRQYRSRIDGLARYKMDVETGVVAAPGRPWSWAQNRAALNEYVLAYLRNRNEDGVTELLHAGVPA